MGTDIGQLLHRALGDLQPPDGLHRNALAARGRNRQRRRLVTGAAAVLAAVAAVALIWATVGTSNRAGTATLIPASPTTAPNGLIPLAQRRPAPGVAGTLGGTTVTGSAFSVGLIQSPHNFGGPPITVINFFGSGCAPCRAEMPQLVKASASYYSGPIPAGPPSGITFVGVDERDSPANARTYVGRAGIDYPVLFDNDGKLQRAWHPQLGLPYTVIVDPDGLIAARFTGAVSAETLESAIKAIQLNGVGGYPLGEGALGLPSAVVNGRTVILAVENARCGNLTQLQFSVVSVRVREDVVAVHVEVIAKRNPAAISNANAQRLCGYTGTKTITHTTITLATPLGGRRLLDDVGQPIPHVGH